jgi:hypothetical protein
VRIIRHTIEVNDLVHLVPVPDQPDPYLHLAARREDAVDLWVLDGPNLPTREAHLLVVGTGQTITPNQRWVGTAVTPSMRLVWHLVEETS